jgi:hypothetical protein
VPNDRAQLKKQSQFIGGHNDVKSVLTMVYGDFNGKGQLKNKAKQSQSFDFAQDMFISVQCSAFSGLRQSEKRA